jgi:hypothetical protein
MTNLLPIDIRKVQSDYEYPIAKTSKVYELVYMTKEHVSFEQLQQLNVTIPNKEVRWRHVAPEDDTDSLIGRFIKSSLAQLSFEDLDTPLDAVVVEAEIFGDTPEQVQAQEILDASLEEGAEPFGFSGGFYTQVADDGSHIRTLAREGSATGKPRCIRCRVTKNITQQYWDLEMNGQDEYVRVPAEITIKKEALLPRDMNSDGDAQISNEDQIPQNPDEQQQPPQVEGGNPPDPIEKAAKPLMEASKLIAAAAKALDASTDGNTEQTDPAKPDFPPPKEEAPPKEETAPSPSNGGEEEPEDEEEEMNDKEKTRKQYSAYEGKDSDENKKKIISRYEELKAQRVERNAKIDSFEESLNQAKAEVKRYDQANRKLAKEIVEKDARIKELENEIQDSKLLPLRTKLAKMELNSDATEDKVKEKIVVYEELAYNEKQMNHMIEKFEGLKNNPTQKLSKADNLPVKTASGKTESFEGETDPREAWRKFKGN